MNVEEITRVEEAITGVIRKAIIISQNPEGGRISIVITAERNGT